LYLPPRREIKTKFHDRNINCKKLQKYASYVTMTTRHHSAIEQDYIWARAVNKTYACRKGRLLEKEGPDNIMSYVHSVLVKYSFPLISDSCNTSY
jgi:hypothetical protein